MKKNYNIENVNVCFHIGHGGHFHKAGCKSFNPNVNTLQDCFGDATIWSEDENGNKLPDDEWQIIDSGDNVILTGRELIESSTGVLDWDGLYDTDIVKPVSECTEDELTILLTAILDKIPMNKNITHYVLDILEIDENEISTID